MFLFAHGSTMMLGEESEPAKIWEEVGNEALRRGVKRIVMMVSSSTFDALRVSILSCQMLIDFLPRKGCSLGDTWR